MAGDGGGIERALSGLLTNIHTNILAEVPAALAVGLEGFGSRDLQPTYSHARLELLWSRFKQFRDSDLEQDKGGRVVEVLRQITEALIWGEQNTSEFFDFFCEKNLLAEFIRVLSYPRALKSVKVQMLQSLSMLVQNIRREQSLYYLLGNSCLNNLILSPLDFTDEEILAYYITLLKSLSMRLNSDTVQFFFRQCPECSFPLYIEATKFFGTRDQMVRATVRTITLQVYPIESAEMRGFVLRHASESYFGQLAKHLRDLWLNFASSVSSSTGSAPGTERSQETPCTLEKGLERARRDNDLQQDFLIYLSDIFELGIKELNEVLSERLFRIAIVPVLLAGVCAGSPHMAHDPFSDVPNMVPVNVQHFLIRLVFETFHSRTLLEPLANALLSSDLTAGHAPRPAAMRGPSTLESAFNPYRARLIEHINSPDDRELLFAAAALHGCLRSRNNLPAGILEAAGLLPQRPAESNADTSGHMGWFMGLLFHPLGACRPSYGKDCMVHDNMHAPKTHAKSPAMAEMMLLLLRALPRHEDWQLDTLRIICSIVSDWFAEPDICQDPRSQAVATQCLHEALKTASRRTMELFEHRPLEDQVLDTFSEEWELQLKPAVDVQRQCGDPSCLLGVPSRSSSSSAMPQRSAPKSTVADIDTQASENERTARRTIRSCLSLRRLLLDLIEQANSLRRGLQGGICVVDEPSPLATEETESPDALREGALFDIGSVERVMCSISAHGSKSTRYLLMHDFWLLLAQPDLSTPGSAVVKTLWPLWQVQSFVDRCDPRILQVGLRARQGGAQPGGAQPVFRSTSAGEENVSAFFTLTIDFEDMERCRAVDDHFRSRREEVREQLLLQATAFTERCCVHLPVF